MAVTVLGGSLSSTLLNLFVLPALAQRYVGLPGRDKVLITSRQLFQGAFG
jgi:hypothetical protein